jgi:XRE family transcriptional regulator, regulator of sulfur utilization
MRRDTQQTLQRLGERIERLRRDRKLTQDALGAKCGLSQKYLSELERGRKTPSFEALVLLAHRGFNVSLSVLLFRVDEVPRASRDVEQLLAGRTERARMMIFDALRKILEAGSEPDSLPEGDESTLQPSPTARERRAEMLNPIAQRPARRK